MPGLFSRITVGATVGPLASQLVYLLFDLQTKIEEEEEGRVGGGKWRGEVRIIYTFLNSSNGFSNLSITYICL